MGASENDLLTAKLFFNAAFPVMQVILDDDPAMHEKFKDVTGVVQMGARNGEDLIACHLVFDRGKVDIIQGPAEAADISLTFSSVSKMNKLLRGGLAMPGLRGAFSHLKLMAKVLSLLMRLMLMMPNSKPKSLAEKTLKVKMSLYMITRALSVYNKDGNPEMVAWTTRQPDRIYQFIVEPYEETNVACYLRVKGGKTKSGHGIYQRRTPFVLFHFFSVEGALKVLGKEVAFVEGVENHCVETVGSPEYACQINDFMAVLQSMLT